MDTWTWGFIQHEIFCVWEINVQCFKWDGSKALKLVMSRHLLHAGKTRRVTVLGISWVRREKWRGEGFMLCSYHWGPYAAVMMTAIMSNEDFWEMPLSCLRILTGPNRQIWLNVVSGYEAACPAKSISLLFSSAFQHVKWHVTVVQGCGAWY